jgi:hypothetical protein
VDVGGSGIDGGGFRTVADVAEVEVEDVDDAGDGSVVGGLVGNGTLGVAPPLPLQAAPNRPRLSPATRAVRRARVENRPEVTMSPVRTPERQPNTRR